MRKAKAVVWLLVIAIMALIVFQNRGHFLDTKQSLGIHLGSLMKYDSPELPLAVFYFMFFAFGLLVAYGFTVTGRFRQRKRIKLLHVNTSTQEKEILSLKTELAQLKGEPPPGAAFPAESSVTAPVKRS